MLSLRFTAPDPFQTSVERRTGHTCRVTRREVIITQMRCAIGALRIAQLEPEADYLARLFGLYGVDQDLCGRS